MEITKTDLASSYSGKTDNELIELYSTATLTDLAYEVIESELSSRGVALPNRPEQSSIPSGRPTSIAAHWRGQASLASAYWGFGVLGNAFFIFLINILSEMAYGAILYLVWMPYFIFSLVAIWRCAWNSSWKLWGYVARLIVVINIVTLIMGLWVGFAEKM